MHLRYAARASTLHRRRAKSSAACARVQLFFFGLVMSNGLQALCHLAHHKMPLPLSLAFFAMRAARSFHAAPSFERPLMLRKVYFARLVGYSGAAIAGVASFLYSPHASDTVSKKNPPDVPDGGGDVQMHRHLIEFE